MSSHRSSNVCPTTGTAATLCVPYCSRPSAKRSDGTCYRAANWIRVGKTQGRGKLDVKNEYALPVKDVEAPAAGLEKDPQSQTITRVANTYAEGAPTGVEHDAGGGASVWCGAGPLVGCQLRNLVGSAHGWLRAVGFAASAHKLECRALRLGRRGKVRRELVWQRLEVERSSVRNGARDRKARDARVALRWCTVDLPVQVRKEEPASLSALAQVSHAARTKCTT